MSRSSKRDKRGGALQPRGNYAKGRAALLDEMYYHLLTELALNRFTWRGLPPTVDERWLEINLYERGIALFFVDKRVGKFLCTQCSYQGRLNLYNNPTRYQPIGVNYHYKTLRYNPYGEGGECVPIWDNRMRLTFKDVMWVYAHRLAQLDKAFDVNAGSMMLPIIVTADTRTRNTVSNILQQREDGQPIILALDALDPSSLFNTFPNATPYLLDKFMQAKSQVTNEAMSYLGIQSSGMEKRERMIEDEVGAANERTDVFRASFLKARQHACTEINRLYHLNVSVEWADPQSPGIPNLMATAGAEHGSVDTMGDEPQGIGGVI